MCHAQQLLEGHNSCDSLHMHGIGPWLACSVIDGTEVVADLKCHRVRFLVKVSCPYLQQLLLCSP